MNLFVRGLFACALLVQHVVVAPAATFDPKRASQSHRASPGPRRVARFRVGETVIVTFSGVPPMSFPPHEEPIKEDGTITLSLIGAVKAVGKTAGELQNEIHTIYVPELLCPPDRHREIRATAFITSAAKSRQPGKQLYLGDTTVTKAIQSAGGLTDFANHSKVWLTHTSTGQRIRVDYDKALENPAMDPPVYPDDQINVEKRIF